MKKIFIRIFLGILIVFLTLGVWVIASPQPVILLARSTIFPISADARGEEYEQDGILVRTNLEYPSEFNKNAFDYYEPNEPQESNPTIIWVHGGGFIGGTRIDIEEYAFALAKEGYHVVVMGYELAPEATYPTPVLQLSELMEYLVETDLDWDINLDNLFLAGDSAGAQIVSQFSMIQTDDEYATWVGIDPVISIDQVRGNLLYCGAFDVDALADSDSPLINFIFSRIGWAYIGMRDWEGSDLAYQASIIAHVNEKFPSSYITDGNTMSFEDQSRAMVELLESMDIEVRSRFFDLEEFETQHVFHFDLELEASQLVFEDTVNFLGEFSK